ncbi:MAG: sigma 54-interacting transcriptional regulator [Candidatus Electryonea clarkiae]|nr:sigma 54-interacting transcriptional regulator [Candidatus Electryonea clarkiae]MDP8286286.1 sigma 54-interacting transcriptional regulator [Candidatus Electryonea clarkiae]
MQETNTVVPTVSNLSPESLQALVSVAQVLTSILDGDALLQKVLEIALETVNAETGFIVLTGKEDNELNVRVSHNLATSEVDDPLQPSRRIVSQSLEERKAVLVHDARTDPRFEGSESVVMHQITSAIAVPLILQDDPVGVVYVDSRGDRGKFTDENKDFFNAFTAFATLAYQNAVRFDQLQDEKAYLQTEVEKAYGFTEIVGVHPAMNEVFLLMRKILHSDITVLLQGESGTGKELVARALHYNGPRREKPFVAQFCGNLSETLLESELFGHVRGAFTGAVSDKKGLFEIADGGTFFLDEIADISPTIQSKLLRILQDGIIRRVGGTDSKTVDVRIVSASNKNLETEVEEGRFRDDLYYRLNVISVRMPSLRERRSDIPLLIKHFLAKSSHKQGEIEKKLLPEAMRRLEDYDWPGNVRELENAIERAVVLSGDNPTITADDLILPQDASSGRKTLRDYEKEIVTKTLDELEGNKTRTAEVLGVSLRWLHYRLNEWKKLEQ